MYVKAEYEVYNVIAQGVCAIRIGSCRAREFHKFADVRRHVRARLRLIFAYHHGAESYYAPRASREDSLKCLGVHAHDGESRLLCNGGILLIACGDTF